MQVRCRDSAEHVRSMSGYGAVKAPGECSADAGLVQVRCRRGAGRAAADAALARYAIILEEYRLF